MKTRPLFAVALVASCSMVIAACDSPEPAAEDTAMTENTGTADMGPPPPADAGAMDGASETSMPAPEDAPAGEMATIAMVSGTCPDDIEFRAEQGGPFYVNGQEADVTVSNPNYYEARSGDVTISVASEAGANPLVSYTGPGRANGICQVG